MKKYCILAMCLLLHLCFFLSVIKAEESKIRIGVLTTMTGNWAAVGENVTRGVELAVDEVNNSGGVLGKKIEFEVQDTDEELSGAKILSAYRYLKAMGVKLFIGPTGVPGSNALGPVAAKDNVVVITSAALTPFESHGKNLFNIIGDSEVTSRASAKWALKKGYKTVSILRSEQPWEYAQGKYFAEEFKSNGGNLLSIQESSAEEKDFKVQALRINNENPDLVFLATFNQVSFAAKALSKFGLKMQKTVALLDDAHLQAANGSLEGSTFFLFQGPTSDFKKKYKKKFGTEPGYASDYSYDSIMALVSAMKIARSSEPKEVVKTLNTLTFPASVGYNLKIQKGRFVNRKIQQYKVINNKIVEVNDTM